MHPSDLIPSSSRPGAPTSEDLLRAGEASLVAGRVDEALRLFATAVRVDGHSSQALTAFGGALAQSGDLARARLVLERSLAADPLQREAWLAMATLELDQSRPSAALGAIDRALALGPMTAELLGILARARLASGDVDGARRAVDHGLGLAPADATLHNVAAAIDRASGNGERAALRLARAASMDPMGQSRAWYELARAGEPLDEAELRAELSAASAAGNRVRLANLHHALAEVLRGRGLPEALVQAAAGNALTATGDAATSISAQVDQTIATFDATYFAQARGAGLRGSAPIVVVGTPSAALDHVAGLLGNHPSTARTEAGHLATLAAQVEPTVGLPFPLGCERLERGHWAGMAHRYVELVGSAARGQRTLDVSAGNGLYLGLVASCLPDARVIHVRRDRRDAALEDLLMHRGVVDLSWSGSLAEIVEHEGDAARLMEHWRKVLSLPLLEVDAADLVREPSIQQRRLCEFAGLALPERTSPAPAAERLRVGAWRAYEAELRAQLPEHWFASAIGVS
ncbi:tetratricopeptide repeat-containing sulfotransferase family protein [Engelhardtia mirabilis]|uniref:Uncharacterized protein n=1 Tax=Engelhardtia mirabilis TaxID=2528011 RepID=A0A518BG12_9BACT|nr:hypothetical protein Pla133_09870 [Planctomycetes bacterium Pla133]QDV00247.1 hypothetical protein Pla86_09860 [Planctomycetes bacterium Pla86]